MVERHDDTRNWPVFLVGCHRSGTTLARFILDTHPSIYCPPESKFLSALYEMPGYPQLLPALRGLGVTPQELLVEMGIFAKRLLDQATVRNKKRRWVDKTPNYYRILPFIDSIFEGRVLYVFISRHPLDTAQSLEETFGYATPRHEGSGNRADHRAIWTRVAFLDEILAEVYETIASFADSAPDRYLRVRYEDIVEGAIRDRR